MPNVVNVFLTLIFGTLIKHLNLTEAEKRTFFLGIVWLLLTFVAGTRGLYALGDTEAYYSTYIMAGQYSFVAYFERLRGDYLFYIINWFFSHCGVPWQTFLLIHSGFVLGVFCSWVGKNSEDPVLSMLIFECLFLQVWQGSLRQALGMALLLLAYDQLEIEGIRPKIIAGVLFLLAVLCHSTALVVLPFILLRKVPINTNTIVLYTIATIGCFVFRAQFLQFINLIANELNRNTYANFWSTNPTTLIALCLLILGLFLLFKAPIIEYYPKAEEYYVAMFIMIALLSLGGGAIVRLSWYCGVVVCLIMPIIAEQFRPSTLAKAIMVVALIGLYLKSANTSQWYFFWQR